VHCRLARFACAFCLVLGLPPTAATAGLLPSPAAALGLVTSPLAAGGLLPARAASASGEPATAATTTASGEAAPAEGDVPDQTPPNALETGAGVAELLEHPCGQPMSQVFLRFADIAFYYRAPGGDAESRRDWLLEGGAAIVPGNEPFGVTPGTRSLALPRGSRATTRPICVGVDSPTVRFLVRDPGIRGAALRVEVLWVGALGERRELTIGRILSTRAGWRPVLPLLALANLSALTAADGTRAIQLRFAPERGAWRVDGLHVDPFCRV
jgi:hypothetical protein